MMLSTGVLFVIGRPLVIAPTVQLYCGNAAVISLLCNGEILALLVRYPRNARVTEYSNNPLACEARSHQTDNLAKLRLDYLSVLF